MENRHLRIMALIAAMFLSVISAGTDALSMGALQKSYTASANPGDVAAFTLLFWNIESEPYDVELSEESVPQGWSIIFDPKNFTLDSSPSGEMEYIYMPYLKKSIGAKVVDVYVHVPDNAAAGSYRVRAVATTKLSGGVMQVNFVGQKKFAFEVIVGGARTADRSALNSGVVIENPGTVETVFSDAGERQLGVIVENPGTFALVPSEEGASQDSSDFGRKSFIAAAAVILAIAWGIYRYG